MAIHQEATFPVAPERIYELLTDGARLSKLVGRRGRGGSAEGAWFSLVGDRFEGRQIELVRAERVVQAWRLADWEPGVYSIVRFTLIPGRTGTRLVVDQDGYPEEFHDVLASTWRSFYFEPMAQQFSRSAIKEVQKRSVTHANAVLLQSTYEAAGKGDLQPLLDALADDITWLDSSLGPSAGVYRGKQEVLAFFGKMAEVYAGTLRVEVVDVVANDHHGVVLTREQGESAGESVTWRGAHLFTFREGRCVEFQAMNDDAYNRFWAARSSSSTRAVS